MTGYLRGRCEAAHAGAAGSSSSIAAPSLRQHIIVEVFLLIWDEVDDWVGACRHLLRR